MSFEFLIEMGWKSALIAGVALALAALLRSRAAADRSTVLRVAVTLLLLLPVLALSFPRLEIEAWTVEAPPVPTPDFAATMPLAETAIEPAAPLSELTAAEPTIWDDPSLLFLLLYLGGVAMAAARLGAGLWTLRRWTAASSEIDCPEWRAAFERARWAAGAPERLRLLVSDEAPSPMSWGLLRPVILIDRDTLDEPEDAEAILAHEIAHVVRRDWAVLMLTRVAAGLFWFNPLVWLLEREVVQQAEEAADIEAAHSVEPARYAQTLVHWAQFNAGAAIPANSIAPSGSALARRVRAILDARLRSTPSGAVSARAAAAGCAGFAVALAALQLVPGVADAHPHDEVPPPAPAAPAAPGTPAAAPAPAAGVAPAAPPALEAPAPMPPAPPKAADGPDFTFAPPAPPHPVAGAPRPPGPHAVRLPHPLVDAGEIGRQVEAALRTAGISAERAAAEAGRAVRQSMSSGAFGLERGAAGMERGAERMRREAQRLRSRSYRERQIAEAARRGETLTHDELLEMIPQLQEGAREMTEGARDMRRSAVDMRREGRD
jgi:beta-lactamase regulating signal transducer with metallopeptidase domain